MVSRAQFPADDDGEVLFRLASKGVDLSVKRLIEFTCIANSEEGGKNISADLESYGYKSEIFYDDSGSISVYSSILILPEYDLILAEQARLNAILKHHDSYCDGWVTESGG